MNALLLGFWILATPAPPAQAQAPPDVGAPLRIPAGDGTHILVPRDETLVYAAHLEVAFIEASVGEVTQTSSVRPYRPSLLLEGDGSPNAGEAGHLSIHAKGDYTLYSIDTKLETRHLPQEWPAIVYRTSRTTSKTRRRENMIGVRGGEPTSSYRRDTDTNAPRGTRIWKDSRYREVPAGTLDMLSSVYLCRTLVTGGLEELVCPMVEKDRLWQLKLVRGREQRMRTPAGVFDAVKILIHPGPWPGESVGDKAEEFEGLFGIHGTIHLWVERNTGVPLRIQGDLPVGPLTLGVDVVLKSFSGTPPEFAPVKE